MPDTFLADFLVGADFKPTLTRSVIFFISDKICAIIAQASFLLFLQQLFQQGGLFFLNSQHAFKKIGGLFVLFHYFVQGIVDRVFVVLIILDYCCIANTAITCFKIIILNHD